MTTSLVFKLASIRCEQLKLQSYETSLFCTAAVPPLAKLCTVFPAHNDSVTARGSYRYMEGIAIGGLLCQPTGPTWGPKQAQNRDPQRVKGRFRGQIRSVSPTL